MDKSRAPRTLSPVSRRVFLLRASGAVATAAVAASCGGGSSYIDGYANYADYADYSDVVGYCNGCGSSYTTVSVYCDYLDYCDGCLC